VLFHIPHPAQRWFIIQNKGPSPSARYGHAMASDGTRVFVLGGISSAITRGYKTAFIHVLDTSTDFLFVISFGQPPSLKTQSTSSTRIPTPTLSNLVRRPPNSRGSHSRVPRPRNNRNTRRPLRRMLTRHLVLPLSKTLPPENWLAPPPRRLLASETPVRMVCHRNPRV
jgi:hypothetical protein